MVMAPPSALSSLLQMGDCRPALDTCQGRVAKTSAAACPGRTVAGAVEQGQSVDRTRRLRPSRRSFLFRFASSLLIVGPSFSEERHPAVSILRGGLELSLFRVLFIPDEAGRGRRGAVEFL